MKRRGKERGEENEGATDTDVTCNRIINIGVDI